MNKLQQAIEDGKAEAKRLQEIKTKELADKLFNDTIQFQKKCEYAKKVLLKNDYIFNLIKEAISKNEKSICLKYDGEEFAYVINADEAFAGIHAQYKSGCDYTDYGRIRGWWSSVSITWDEK